MWIKGRCLATSKSQSMSGIFIIISILLSSYKLQNKIGLLGFTALLAMEITIWSTDLVGITTVSDIFL